MKQFKVKYLNIKKEREEIEVVSHGWLGVVVSCSNCGIAPADIVSIEILPVDYGE